MSRDRNRPGRAAAAHIKTTAMGVHQKVGGLFWKLLQNQEDPRRYSVRNESPVAQSPIFFGGTFGFTQAQHNRISKLGSPPPTFGGLRFGRKIGGGVYSYTRVAARSCLSTKELCGSL